MNFKKASRHRMPPKGMNGSPQTPLMRKIAIIIFCIAAILVMLFGLGLFGVKFAREKLVADKVAIQEEISRQIGYPVTFSKIDVHWVGSSLSLALSDVVLHDTEKPIPFLSMSTLELRSKLWSIFKDWRVGYDKLVVTGLQAVVGYGKEYENQGAITLLGLSGTSISSGLDPQKLFANLSGKQIRFKEGVIQWKGSNSTFTQHFRGKLDTLPDGTIQFLGKQEWDLGARWVPESRLNMTLKPNVGEYELFSTVLGTKINCTFNSQDKSQTENGSQLQCQLMAEDLDLGTLRSYLKISDSDPAALRWLIRALPEGEITQAHVALKGPVNDVSWSGNIKFNDVDFIYVEGWPGLTDARGKIQFEKQTLHVQVDEANASGNMAPLHNIEATIEPISASRPLVVEVVGKLTTEVMQAQFPIRWLDYLHGSTNLKLKYFEEDGRWQITSDLKGIEVDLPPPLQKNHENNWNTQLTVYPSDNGEDRIALNVEGLLDAKWTSAIDSNDNSQLTAKKNKSTHKTYTATPTNKKSPTETKPLVLKRGQFVFGTEKSEWITKPILSVLGNVPILDIDEWWNFMGEQESSLQVPNIQVNLSTQQLEFFGLQFENTAISLNLANQLATLALKGPSLNGSIELPGANRREVKLDFTQLKIESKTIEAVHSNEFFSSGNKLPIIFNANELVVDGRWLGNVVFNLEPNEEGFKIQELRARTDAYSVLAKGQWLLQGRDSLTKISGEVTSNDMGKMFAQWGFESSIKEGRGKIQFDIQWPNTPFQFSLATLAGSASVQMQSGRVLGVDLGLGKILNLLSIGNIARTLRMDFSDLKKGFAIDSLKTNLVFQDGFIRTEGFTVEGPSANIGIMGTINLSSKELDLQMSVAPKLGGSLPLAAGLATGNPLIGLGALVVGELVGSQIGAMTQHYYHVTGPWDSPKIQEMGTTKRSGGRRKN